MTLPARGSTAQAYLERYAPNCNVIWSRQYLKKVLLNDQEVVQTKIDRQLSIPSLEGKKVVSLSGLHEIALGILSYGRRCCII